MKTKSPASFSTDCRRPGDAERSLLYSVISSDSPPVATRMPQVSPVLHDDEISLIRKWIEQGAEFAKEAQR